MNKLIAWFKSFWAKLFTKKQPKQTHTTKQNTPKRTYNKQKSKTLSDLLDNLEYTFDAMKIDYEVMFSHLKQKDIEGLKKFGVSVIPTDVKDPPNNSRVSVGKFKLPAILFTAKNMGEEGNSEIAYPDFFYGIKRNKFPWFVAKKKTGAMYECGFGFRDVTDKKIYWTSFFVTIDPQSGQIFSTHHLAFKPVPAPGKHCYGKDQQQHGGYTKRQWEISSWDNDREDMEKITINAVAHNFNLWISRLNMWSTTVEKNGNRATFYVNSNETKDYFKNREKVVTVDGKTKRIIHYVESHERTYASGKKVTIKEHIRGLSKFNWNGFFCYVTAPKFHLIDVREFDIASEEHDDDDKNEYMGIDQVADYLHSLGGLKNKEVNTLH